jgi:hypothetical protein
MNNRWDEFKDRLLKEIIFFENHEYKKDELLNLLKYNQSNISWHQEALKDELRKKYKILERLK